jgi:NAD(P)-dependent dehydrogenase (short-subunit alcohol dehydrogenase family)
VKIEGNFSLVSGASSGIGREVAISLSKSRNLILTGRRGNELEITRELCNKNSEIKIWVSDFSYSEQIRGSLREFLFREGVYISEFVNCAGQAGVGPVRLNTHAKSLHDLEVNYLAPLEIVSELINKRTNNRLLSNCVFISSIWSKGGAAGYTNYSGSKAALDGAMRSMAIELAPNVRFNSIILGAVETPMSQAALSNEATLTKMLERYPLGIGKTKDVADLISFLLSHESRWMTGQQIVLDGGRSANYSY